MPEKTKRGPPTNKNIPVRNIMAQISNMSTNENAGFKSEYHVRFIFPNFVLLITFKVYSYNDFVLSKNINIQQTKHHWQEIPRGELHLCTEAKKPENKAKNRYTTIFPCMY